MKVADAFLVVTWVTITSSVWDGLYVENGCWWNDAIIGLLGVFLTQVWHVNLFTQ